MRKAFLALVITLLAIVAFYFIVPGLSFKTCRETNGKVCKVYTGSKKSICLKISEGKLNFHFGKRASQKWGLEQLRSMLLDQKVRIRYYEGGTILAPSQQKEIAELQVGNQILYSENQP